MRRFAVMLAALALVLVPTTAAAGPPAVVFEETFEWGPELDEHVSGHCGFDVFIQGRDRVKVTVFFDKHGNERLVRTKINGENHFTTDHGATAFDRWAFSLVEDLVAENLSVNGNVWNVHAGGGGILVNDSGKLVIEFSTGDVIIHGPHDAFFEDPAIALCEGLAP